MLRRAFIGIAWVLAIVAEVAYCGETIRRHIASVSHMGVSPNILRRRRRGLTRRMGIRRRH